MIRFLIGFGMVGAFIALAQAENTRPADTPPIVQVTLGPDYRDLPEDGGQYCVPTAHTMGLFWLNTMGFTTLAPTFSEAEGYNLDRIIAGLMGTGDGTHGGTTGAGASAGMELYFNLKGLSGNFSGTSIPQPTGAELGSTLVGTYDFAVINIGWFRQSGTSSTYVQNSGHDVTLVEYTSTGAISGTATINNPEPRSLYDVPNLPSEVQQAPGVAAVSGITLVGTSGTLSGDYLQFITPTHPGSGHLAVILGVDQWGITTTPGFTPTTFQLTKTETINTNGGSFTAEAPLGDGGNGFGLIKTGEGTMTLSGSNSTTGTWQVENGTLASTLTTDGVQSATPLGTGDLLISGGSTLAFNPDTSSASPGNRNVELLVASGSEKHISIGPGNSTLALNRGGNDSLTITIGGFTGGGTPNLALEPDSTLVLRIEEGLAALGNSTRILVSGTADNLPTVTNGRTHPALLGQDNDGSRSGALLTYEETNGFVLATVTSGSTLAGTTDTTLYATSGSVALATSSTTTLAALVANHDIIGPNATLAVTPATTTGAGLILNGATLSLDELQFGNKTGFIYANDEGGTINAVVSAESVVTFGPGQTTLSGTTANITGSVYVNAGTLSVANQGIGNAAVTVRPNATLKVSGTLSGEVKVDNNATLILEEGTTTGTLLLSADSHLGGKGHISYSTDTTLRGSLGSPDGAGNLVFEVGTGTSELNVEARTIFNFTLASLTGTTPGEDWTFFNFQNGFTADEGFVINLNFVPETDPANPTNAAYWSSDHEWNLMEFAEGSAPNPSNITMPEAGLFYSGKFSFAIHSGLGGTDNFLAVRYAAVPEPSTLLLVIAGVLMVGFSRRSKNPDQPQRTPN